MYLYSNWLKALLYSCTILCLFSACKVGKKYQQPSLALPEQYRFQADTISPQDTTSLALVPWDEFFTDTLLLQLIEKGLQNNNDMKTALLNVQKTNRLWKQSKLNFLPQIEADLADISYLYRSEHFRASESAKWYDEKGRDAPDNMFLYQSDHISGLNMKWEVDLWGKISSKKEAALANYLQTFEAQRLLQTQIVSSIAKGYFNLLILDAQIDVAKRNLALNESTLQMIRLQFKAGEISALAMQQTESQRLIAASLIPELEEEIAVQENTLLALVGEMPNGIVRSSTLDHALLDSLPVHIESPIALLRNRPDVRAAELDLKAANAKANVQQALLYPSLTLGGRMGVNAMLSGNWFSIPGALFGNVLGGISQPIFQGKKVRTDFEVAKIERDKSEVALQQTILEAVNEVTNNLVIVDKQKEQLRFAEERVQNAQLAVKNASLLFKSGYATYLEVITAQGNALTSDLNLVRMKQQQLNAVINLYRSVGGGWERM